MFYISLYSAKSVPNCLTWQTFFQKKYLCLKNYGKDIQNFGNNLKNCHYFESHREQKSEIRETALSSSPIFMNHPTLSVGLFLNLSE